MPRNYQDRAVTLPKEPTMADALHYLTELEWRLRRDGYECRVNHTQAKAMVQILEFEGITVSAQVSEQRSGRYIVAVPADQEKMTINAAIRASKAAD